MTLAAIDWLTISIDLLIGIFVIVCLIMSLIILMQRPKNEGLGAAFGSGTTDQLFGARTTNVLQRGTVYLATLFFVIALALSILIGQKNKRLTYVREDAAPAAEEVQTTPTAEEQPVEPEPVVPPPAAEEETEEPQPEEEPAPPPPAEEEQPEEAPPAEEPPAEEPAPEEP